MTSTASHALLNVFRANDIDRVFLVPGESYLGILDALVDFPDIDAVICRHEGGAGYMAVADGRLTGRPGVVMVSRGPGASNAAIAIHTAQQDAVPLIMVVGQIPKKDLRREAFQEIDYQKMFGSIAKWVFEPTDPAQLAESAFKAIRMATSGTPGPVVLVIPEDIQQQPVAQPDWRACAHGKTLPAPDDIEAIAARLARAERPLIIAGGSFEQPGGREALAAFAQAWQIPVAVSFRRHDVFPNTHALFVGELGLANARAQIEAFDESDFILALGTRLGDIPTQGYTFPASPQPKQTLLHCHPDGRAIGLQHAADIGLACDPVSLVQALTAAGTQHKMQPPRQAWIDRLKTLQQAHARWPERTATDGVDFTEVIKRLARVAPEHTAICVDAGTFAAPVYRHFPFVYPQRLMSPLAGAMGYGTPAAIATAMRLPEAKTICMVGDGGFLMTGNEMIAAVQRKLPILFIVSNNACYASIRIHQEKFYPGRESGTALFNPDFVAMAQAFGMPARRVSHIDEIDDALEEGLAASGPMFIEVDTSLAVVLP
ncbi:MAG: pyruvate decarboxylase [Comamonadaceae bacterium]|nr:MAG: pyruvate decarboxylase [Comamonadaceae bacterium]